MPVSIVVGGQFGSEGKGKVALELAKMRKAAAVVRVGGTNSGHTGVNDHGELVALRQLPAASLCERPYVILPPGSLIDPTIFLAEVEQLGFTPDRVKVDPRATVIAEFDKQAEVAADLVTAIGSTASGTGAALARRVGRRGGAPSVLARDHEVLKEYLENTTPFMRALLDRGERIIIEGTQGFGLSVLHGDEYPKATSRDTTAASFLGEAGLSPMDVDQVVLVIRTYPIRVAGNSGKLSQETTWKEIADRAGLPSDHT